MDRIFTIMNKMRKKRVCLLVITGGALDCIYHLDLDHVLQLNDIPTTYNLHLCKKTDTLVKVTSHINYVINYSNDHIDQDYCIHVLKEEATNTPSSLLLIQESAIASKALASTTVQVANFPPTARRRERVTFYCRQYCIGKYGRGIIDGENANGTRISN